MRVKVTLQNTGGLLDLTTTPIRSHHLRQMLGFLVRKSYNISLYIYMPVFVLEHYFCWVMQLMPTSFLKKTKLKGWAKQLFQQPSGSTSWSFKRPEAKMGRIIKSWPPKTAKVDVLGCCIWLECGGWWYKRTSFKGANLSRHIPYKGTFWSFPRVGYVNSLEGILLKFKNPRISVKRIPESYVSG